MRLLPLPGVFQPPSDSYMLADQLRRERLGPHMSVLDLCTGSGHLAVVAALAGAPTVATDVSRRAMLSVRLNARLNGVRVTPLRGNLFAPVAGRRFDVIVSNPPYLPHPDEQLPDRGLARAVDAGPRGRAFLDRICAEAGAYLTPGGVLLLVHSSVCGERETLDALSSQGLEAETVFRHRGPLGPRLHARVDWLRAEGMLLPDDQEDVIIVRAVAPEQAAPRASTGSDRIDPRRLAGLAARVTVVPGAERAELEVENPATGQRLASVPRCTAEDVELAVERARTAQAAWARSGWTQREAVLMRVHDLVLERQDEALDVIQLESGKARRHAFEEILDVALVSRYYARSASRLLRTRRRRGALPFLTATWEHHHPVGVVGVISPWNYPLTLSISDAIPAIAAGNAVVMKVDSKTPFSGLIGVSLLEEAGLPRDVVQVITGSGAELGPELIGRVDYVMFTGSTATGRQVASQAAERLIPSSMELGGKNAMLVLADASLSRAVEGAERAMFSNAGQLCISIERLYVHESIADEFVGRLIKRMRRMRLGAGLSYDYDMGSLISAEQLEAVRSHVDDAVAHGAAVLAGGRARPDLGPYFYEPTLLAEVRPGMSLFDDETFGPVVAVSTFADEDEAVERANAGCFGLNFSVWTRDVARGRRIAARLEAGTVNVNEGYVAAWGSVDAPMGGMKDSGLGRRHGATGILKYTEPQTVSVQRLMGIAPPPLVGVRVWARLMTIGLKLLSRVPGVR